MVSITISTDPHKNVVALFALALIDQACPIFGIFFYYGDKINIHKNMWWFNECDRYDPVESGCGLFTAIFLEAIETYAGFHVKLVARLVLSIGNWLYRLAY